MRNEIMNGQLVFPSLAKVEEKFGKDLATLSNSMFQAVWHNYLINKGPISSAYWHDKFANPQVFNIIVMSLSNAGWIKSYAIPERNWLEIHLNEHKLLEFVSHDELEQVRASYKFSKYRLRNTEAQSPDLVRINGSTKRTGLYRKGFQLAANVEFSYDKVAMRKFKAPIIANLTKSMTKIREFREMDSTIADYDAVSVDIYHWLARSNESFTRGNTFMDSRGRAISSSLAKVANPISSKDFRALLVIPKKYRVKATDEGVLAILLFIAELSGYKAGHSMEDKTAHGLDCYLKSFQHNLDWSIEDDRKDVYENIWLSRLYSELDNYYNLHGVEGELAKALALATKTFDFEGCDYEWTVPIELDAGASMLQYIAMLLNDSSLATMTNMVEGELTDPWSIPGLSRLMVKKAATPMLYGSTKNAAALWQQEGISYTLDHVHAYNQALAKGGLGIANQFKDFVLNYCKPKEVMQVTLWNDTFSIECNRHKNMGDKTSMYQVYDSDSHSVKSVFHTSIKKIPDLEQFKRYFQTLLVHNMDSQVADEISYAIAADDGFIIDIHDAFIINPEDASRVRSMYGNLMNEIRDNRHEILGNYFSSIGIGGEANEAWQQLMSKVTPLPDDFVCGPMALK